MPRPRLNTRAISASLTPPARWISAKMRRDRPAAPLEDGVEVVAEDPGDVAGQPAAGDVGDGVDLDGVEQ